MSSPLSSAGAPNAYQPPFAAEPPPRRNSALWWVIGGGLAAMCCCGGPCIGMLVPGVYVLVSEGANVGQVVTGFLEDINAKRTDSALDRFSANAISEASLTREKMEELADDPNFRGAAKASVSSINIKSNFNSDPKVPQGTFAEASGSISYSGGDSGTFNATLQKEGGKWRLRFLRIKRGGGSETKVGVSSPSSDAS